jgi:DNA-binding PucR family transcriptional regulator
VLVDTLDDGLVVLVPGLPRDAAPGTVDRTTRTITRIHRAAPTSTVGVSAPVGQLRDAPRALDEATRAEQLCAPGASVLADQRWFDVAVSRLRDSIRDSLAVGGPLSRLDDTTSADLRTTLATWLAADGDVRATAAQLHLHPNSVRYRLQRAARLSGIDLDDPLQRLVAHLALTSG